MREKEGEEEEWTHPFSTDLHDHRNIHSLKLKHIGEVGALCLSADMVRGAGNFTY
jgi:hypothetical protein